MNIFKYCTVLLLATIMLACAAQAGSLQSKETHHSMPATWHDLIKQLRGTWESGKFALLSHGSLGGIQNVFDGCMQHSIGAWNYDIQTHTMTFYEDGWFAYDENAECTSEEDKAASAAFLNFLTSEPLNVIFEGNTMILSNSTEIITFIKE